MNDASTLDYRSVGQLCGRGNGAHQFVDALRGITVDRVGHLCVVGDRVVKVFAEGALLRQWKTSRRPCSVAVDEEGRVWVGEPGQVEIFEKGTDPVTWTDPDRLGLITAIAIGKDGVFLGDAHARCIHRYDRDGNWLNDIGDTHRKGGFHIPNGVVDFALAVDGILHVTNPGMHRVERWTTDGTLLGRFGRFNGQDPEGFPGCCNPTNLALGSAGRVIATEKAGPRLKVYDADGGLLTVVADDLFSPAAKNMDVAVDANGRIYVADTETLTIHVFAPTNGEAGP